MFGAAGPATSSEKSQQLVVPSRSYAFEVTGDIICPGFVQGIDHLRDPRLNKVHLEKNCHHCFNIKYSLKRSKFCPFIVDSNVFVKISGFGFHTGGASSAWYPWIATGSV